MTRIPPAHSWFLAAGVALVCGCAALASQSWRFGYDFDVPEMPILPMVGALVALGAAYLVAAVALTRLADQEPFGAGAPDRSSRRIMLVVVLVGAAARLAFVASEPILEDDYQRYLWDGAVAARGYNPYAIVPGDAVRHPDPGVRALAADAGLTLDRVNHPDIRTIYPPGAQLFFALAHKLAPFSLAAWRTVVLAADVATFAVLLLLLQVAGRPLVWSALYWWNPLVLKELTNSVHMEAVLLPVVLLAVWFAVRQRPVLATIAIAMAGAIKIWPLALFPLLVRAATPRVALYVACTILVVLLTALWIAPMVLAGLDRSAGVVAYADKWRTNSAGFETLLTLAKVTGVPGQTGISANHLARGFIAAIVVLAGCLAAFHRPRDPASIINRAALVTIIVFLASPAQFPWYVLWIAPFLPFLPWPGLLILAATMPLYYVAFHLMSIDAFRLYNAVVIWMVWIPVWALLILQAVTAGPIRRGRSEAALTAAGTRR